MTVRGTVKKGKVLLNDPTALAEGTEVEVRPVKTRKPKAEVRKPKGDRRSLAERPVDRQAESISKAGASGWRAPGHRHPASSDGVSAG